MCGVLQQVAQLPMRRGCMHSRLLHSITGQQPHLRAPQSRYQLIFTPYIVRNLLKFVATQTGGHKTVHLKEIDHMRLPSTVL